MLVHVFPKTPCCSNTCNLLFSLIQGVSVNWAILQHCFFLVWPHWGGCRYHHFAANFKAFYKNGDSFVITQCEFRRMFGIHHNRVVPSGHAIRIWVWNFEATGSTLKKKGGSVKSVKHWLQTARVTQSSDAQNGVNSFNGVSHYCNILWCTYCFYTTTIRL